MTNDELNRLYTCQLRDFKLAQTNYAELKNVVWREIAFDRFRIRLQYNPARMLSTNARIDTQALQNRPCFLCRSYMPVEQQGLRYNPRYSVFVNPYPIFEHHFTVPDEKHELQRIDGRFEDLLALALDFPEYTVFYNGPACGASAPDHFHFQMVPRYHMPLEQDVLNDILRQYLLKKDFYSVSVLKDYLREVILLQASDLKLLSSLFQQLLRIIGRHIPFEDEPMFNLLCWFDNCQWTVCLFPRRIRRPWQFYAQGEEKILFSPGCVDMAGLIIAPRYTDFIRYSAELLRDLFGQVTADRESWEKIVNDIGKMTDED